MRKRKHALLLIAVFIAFSLLLRVFSQTSVFRWPLGFAQRVVATVAGGAYAFPLSLGQHFWKEEERLRVENTSLQKKLVDATLLEKENKALRDQFLVGKPRSTTLLPARIVAAARFIPGISPLETLIIDKGKSDGVSVGQAVVFGGHLVGKVARTSQALSEVMLVVHPNFSSTVKTANSQALGVVRGQGGGKIVFDNVLMSETLSVSDVVVPFGEGDASFVLVPPDVAVGTITAVEKNPSDLFQSAAIRSALDFSKLSLVFVYMGVAE